MTVRMTRLLEFDYFASFLLSGTFLVLGVSILAVPNRGNPTRSNPIRVDQRWFWPVLAAACLISILPLAEPGFYKGSSTTPVALPGMFLAGALAIRLVRPKSPLAWCAATLAVAAASFCLIPQLGGLAWRTPLQANWMNATRRVGIAVQTIARRLPPDKYPAFWFSYADSGEFQPIMVSFLSHGISMPHFPEVDAGRRYEPGQILLLLNTRRGMFDSAGRTMERAGMPLSLLWEQQIASDGVAYWITATEVQSSKARTSQ